MLLFLITLVSCKTTTKIVEVPVETIKTEYIHDTKIDSVYIRDSIDRWQKGDTIYIAKWHTKYKYINKTDTILKIDSIPTLVTKIVTKEKKVEINHIYWWQETLMWLGGILGLILLLYVIYKIKK